MNNRILAGIILVLAAISCKEENEATPYTYSKIFSGENQKTWVIQEVREAKVGEDPINFDFASCELDDRYTFKADDEKSFVVDNGNSSCPVDEGQDPEEDVYAEATWSFVNSGAVLTIPIPRIFGNFYVPFTVREITSSRMVLEIFADQGNTISYQVVMKSVAEE
jgi:hypothetical protein